MWNPLSLSVVSELIEARRPGLKRPGKSLYQVSARIVVVETTTLSLLKQTWATSFFARSFLKRAIFIYRFHAIKTTYRTPYIYLPASTQDIEFHMSS